MKKFKSLALKLAVIDALLEKNLLKKEIAAFEKQFPLAERRKSQKALPGALRFFADLEIAPEHLAKIKSISFEGGNEIYRLVVPEWDGEDDQFTVRDLADLVHLPNLQSLKDTVLVEVDDAAILRKLPKLKSVDVNFGSGISDKTTISTLEKSGIKIENKAPAEKALKGSGDTKLRLALDYERAQELLWDEEKPAEALSLLEKCLEKYPRDVDCWFEKGNALAALNKPDDAAAAWTKCLELKQKHSEANYNLANHYKDRREFGEALLQINAALANGMKNAPEAWHIRGQLRLALGKKTAATGDLLKASALYEKNLTDEDERAENLFQLACVHALLGNSAFAKDYLRQSIALDRSFRKRANEDSDLKGVSLP